MKMTKRVTLIVIGSVIVVGLLLCTVAYTVDYTEHAVVTNNITGETVAIDGRTDAGLKFKLFYPIQEVTVYDGRTLLLEDPISETVTRDDQNMLVSAYCAWRIEDGVKFRRTIVTQKAAEERLRKLLTDRKKEVVSEHDMSDFVNTDPGKMLIPQIEQEIFGPLQAKAWSSYGIRVISVGIKTLGLPEGVTKQVIQTMKSEREEEAGTIREAGKKTADAIRDRAREASKKILAFAKRTADGIESEGYQAAAELYPKFSRNWDFSMQLRKLKSLEVQLSGPSVLLLDGSGFLGEEPSGEGGLWLIPRSGKAPKKKGK